jgi:hypothetical protein
MAKKARHVFASTTQVGLTQVLGPQNDSEVHMSSRRNRIVAIALVILSGIASAQDRRPAIVSMNGVGTHSCGTYLEFKKTGNETMSKLYQQWSAGYFAGYDEVITKPGMKTNLNADLVTYTAWLDKWCSDDPSSNVYAGLMSLRLKLQGKK